MLGAIIGDMVGSIYEFDNIKTTSFPLFSERSTYTDDSIMTVAVAEWLLSDNEHSHESLEEIMVRYAHEYPCPMGGYGGGFAQWLFRPERLINYKTGEKAGRRVPYNSWGNGSAMRVAAVGWKYDTLEETERVAAISAAITHDHPEGVKGAQATAAAIFLARTGSTKEQIKEYMENRFGYDLSVHTDEIRKVYGWESSCQGTVPPAIRAFLDSDDYESAVRIAVSLGGDSDTLACITGGIAEAFYKEIPQEIIRKALTRLSEPLFQILEKFADSSFYADLFSSYKTQKVMKNENKYDLSRFHEDQEYSYQSAFAEIKEGYKRSHWMWYIFPQIKGLGRSSTSEYYGITCLDEAKAYLEDAVLGTRLKEICVEILKHSDKSAQAIFGGIDSMKLKSSMTLFDKVSPNQVFGKVLDVFFDGKRDKRTLDFSEISR